MKKKTKERASREGAAFPGVLLDYDHFSLNKEKPSEAAGWIVEMGARAKAARGAGKCGSSEVLN